MRHKIGKNLQLDLMHFELGIDARKKRPSRQKSLRSSKVRYSPEFCYFEHELAAESGITLYCRLTLISKQGFVAKIDFISFKPRSNDLEGVDQNLQIFQK